MPNVYEDIKRLIFDPPIFDSGSDILIIRDEHKDNIIKFLDKPYNPNAKELFDYLGKIIHENVYIYSLLDNLARYEERFTDILPNHRDHYKHSACVYALGLALYNSNKTLRKALKTQRYKQDDDKSQIQSFLYRWSLAAALHDLSYPLQMSLESFNTEIFNIQNGIRQRFIKINKEIIVYFNDVKSKKPINGITEDSAIGLIANFLTSRDFVRTDKIIDRAGLTEYITKEIYDQLDKGIFDHGVFSALIILKEIHMLYTRNPEWDIETFYYEVVDAATAIFLHNFFKNTNIKEKLKCSSFKCSYPNPLGYLLCLCDTLCEWNREDKSDFDQYHLIVLNKNEFEIKVPLKKRDRLTSDIGLLNEEITIHISNNKENVF